MPRVRTLSSSFKTISSSLASGVPVVAVIDNVYKKGSAVGTRPPDTDDASPRSTRARYNLALRWAGGVRKLAQRLTPFAPVRTASSTSIGKKSGSEIDGARYASFR